MIAFLVRQLFDAIFREAEGLLSMKAEYFELDDVPDDSVLFKKNARHFTRPETLYQKLASF
jgi:hypothetical protein